MNCRNCELLQDDYPIKVIDFASPSPFANEEIYHFEEAFHCNGNGVTSPNLSELQDKCPKRR